MCGTVIALVLQGQCKSENLIPSPYTTQPYLNGGCAVVVLQITGTLTLKLPITQLWSALSSASDFKSHFCKLCGSRSGCSSRSSLIRVHTVCLYAKIGLKSLQDFSRRHKQTTFSDADFLGILKVNNLFQVYLILSHNKMLFSIQKY